MAEEFTTLEEFRASVKKDLVPEILAAADPLIAQRVGGALTLVEQKLGELGRLHEQFQATHAQALQETRAAIPRMPDLSPIEAVMASLAQVAQLLRDAAVAPAWAIELGRSVDKLVKSHEQMCERMDRPTIREGTAQLPSGGVVKLRTVDSKGK